LHITTAGHDALRIMLDLALHPGEAPILRQDISERQGISSDYIAQLFGRLHKAGLVKSVRAPGGGSLLPHPASQIIVGDIIRAIEGPTELRYCVAPGAQGTCQKRETCLSHSLWVELSVLFDTYLNGVTLQDLCDRSDSLAHSPLLDSGPIFEEEAKTKGPPLFPRI
jgi:Rrf2 family transcriptional regulator, iron-sulfur cluster assembly transcription factor